MTTILIVDDMQCELDLMSQYLTQLGYTIITATNGEEALEKIKQTKPDAIVTDWMMPKMGGVEISRQLKKNPDTAQIPIVVCTAKNRDVDRIWAKKQGINTYLTKPYTQEELAVAIQTAMG
jgi:two-component system, chemotaxis family, response regulator PixH